MFKNILDWAISSQASKFEIEIEIEIKIKI
jgi:hypothetical protein